MIICKKLHGSIKNYMYNNVNMFFYKKTFILQINKYRVY